MLNILIITKAFNLWEFMLGLYQAIIAQNLLVSLLALLFGTALNT